MSALIVTAAVAVLPTRDGREQYLYQGAVFDSEAITDDGIEHARTQGLIDDAPEIVEDEDEDVADWFTQSDVDDAVRIATEAKDAELAEARTAVEDKAREVAKEIADLATAKAEFEKTQADAKVESPKAPANKTTAAKQS